MVQQAAHPLDTALSQSTSNRVNTYQQSRQQQQQTYKLFTQQLSALILTRVFVLGPFERMKIILQVNPIANFANPSDRPKGFLDLSNKISLNQGIAAYYRGNAALLYKLAATHFLKFTLYETLFQTFNTKEAPFLASVCAASFTALLTTAVTYPLDLAHGRMAADMSKKTSVIAVSKNSPASNRPSRLYSSVRDCLTRTQEQSGVLQSRKFLNMFKGIQSAMIAQIPYTVVLMSCFEGFSHLLDSENTKFQKRDDYMFLYKFLTRFGASTLSLIIAQALCYPLDTVKRRMQLNGAQGYKNIYKNDLHCLQTILKKEGIAKGLYAGWSVNMIRCVPLTLIQYTFFQNLRFISKQEKQSKKSNSSSNFTE